MNQGLSIVQRRFMLLRREDETGVSGTGHVADGVVFEDGTVAIRWRTATRSSGLYESVDAAKKIHGHDGKTVFEFHDDDTPIEWLCCRCFADMDVPTNHCFQCGGGGTAVAMSKSQLDMIQEHDKQRLESLTTYRDELVALRAVAIDRFGPTALGYSVRRWDDQGTTRRSICRGNTSTSGQPKDDETDEAFMRRAGPYLALDPDHVQRLLVESSPTGSDGT